MWDATGVSQVASRFRVNSHALRALRRLSGKTQADLALEGQVTHSYISRLERGQRLGCTSDVLQRLAVALGVPVSALVAADKASSTT
ncbi:helix-turn-helix domain-containing protein [Nonomuraea sediminis]|uniref:helix-turn-helix domain-containing protein n=1 Tax=Nonomuraea sediminis TaxID=2835864 RepID=UPI003558C0FB